MQYQNRAMGNYQPMNNQGSQTSHGRLGGNVATVRGDAIPEFLASGRPSQNMVQAHLKTLRFYRRVCRLLPFILRVHDLNTKVSEHQAMINVANIIRSKAYLRDPAIVDRWVYKGFEILQQAEWHYCQRDHLFKFLCNEKHGDQGYSYLEDVKHQGKSGFLRDFLQGNKSYEY